MVQATAGEGTWSRFAGLSVVYVTGFGVGLLALLYLSRLWKRPKRVSYGPGAMAAAELKLRQPPEQAAALRVGMSIAAGSGCTTSPKGSRSARPPAVARSRWPRC
jgi:hypothetical protein